MPNSTSRRGDVLRVGVSPIPKTRKIEVQRVVRDQTGSPVLDEHEQPVLQWVRLDGWVYGPATPLSVKIQLQEAYADRRLEESRIVVPQELRDLVRSKRPNDPMFAVEDKDGNCDKPVDVAWSEKRAVAEWRYNRECLRILVPDLEEDEVERLASDEATFAPIFRHLEYWNDTADDGEADADSPLAEAGQESPSASSRSSGSSRGSTRRSARATG